MITGVQLFSDQSVFGADEILPGENRPPDSELAFHDSC